METIEVRVARSLGRLGFPSVRVTDLGDGHVKLVGTVPAKDDQTAILALVATVPGVVKVSSDFS